MNKKWITVILIGLCIIIIFLIYRGFMSKRYAIIYFGKFGLSSGSTYEQVINYFGEPLRVEEDMNYRSIYYEDTRFGFMGRLVYIETTNPKYRFGWRRIGVSSTKEEVEKAYKKAKKIKDEENEICFIDGKNWDDINVTFTLNENNIVEKVGFGYGP